MQLSIEKPQQQLHAWASSTLSVQHQHKSSRRELTWVPSAGREGKSQDRGDQKRRIWTELKGWPKEGRIKL
jgi:hypothetical protein